jgi:hypothetical protein
MPTFDFGQPERTIVQMAYIVPDLHEAMDVWTRDLGAGPWFHRERFTGLAARYRGQPSTAAITLAMGFAGHMQIELIQPLDDEPSIYREVRDARGWGFHHFGMTSRAIEDDAARFTAQGDEEAFRLGVPTGGEVVYLDTRGRLPGMLELIPASPALESMFTRFYRASLDWDGTDPVRPFA